ncbi:hypothetical protein [Oleiagrimonas soli]|uniref:Quercetin dioxygenase-like cupin family protein n=1 Tax=Oleiagrimonas soli TaxID=1543381 RepID=A0A841KDP2_9GAMM|nr:hypothetical protein [Oleiagrimonas soli]MBB6183045.1 quercetin dioxygenase-like cupin family protein [Oleiagrimonas soli]
MTAPRPASSLRIVLGCADLDAALAFYTEELDFRLDMIMPADAPRMAALSGYGLTLVLRRVAAVAHPGDTGREAASMSANRDVVAATDWVVGRAGMQYRDLIPGRWEGRIIASHIRIPQGGPVPDYVHYHRVGFQMIFCRRGWVRVVYEDQGPPFVMQEGDCVLQPPTIRHRVLEASPGLEVVEVGCPAEHETWRDHALTLPTPQRRPQRLFDGQRFVRAVAADAPWRIASPSASHCMHRDTGIAQATDGVADVRILRASSGSACRAPTAMPEGGARFVFVLRGRLGIHGADGGMQELRTDEACLRVLAQADTFEALDTDAEWLDVCLSPRALAS